MDKTIDQNGWLSCNAKWCKTCKYSKGENIFENSPMKAYCIVYSRKMGVMKPDDVYYFGKECKFYKKDE